LEGLRVGEGCDGGEVEVAEEVRGGHWDRECWCCCRRGRERLRNTGRGGQG
jgi:hypothetical protein